MTQSLIISTLALSALHCWTARLVNRAQAEIKVLVLQQLFPLALSHKSNINKSKGKSEMQQPNIALFPKKQSPRIPETDHNLYLWQ